MNPAKPANIEAATPTSRTAPTSHVDQARHDNECAAELGEGPIATWNYPQSQRSGHRSRCCGKAEALLLAAQSGCVVGRGYCWRVRRGACRVGAAGVRGVE